MRPTCSLSAMASFRPHIRHRVLKSDSGAVVLEICDQQGIDRIVRDITLDEVVGADEVFCTGTMGELAAVTSIDGHSIGTGSVGPMTVQLSTAFRARTDVEGHQVVE